MRSRMVLAVLALIFLAPIALAAEDSAFAKEIQAVLTPGRSAILAAEIAGVIVEIPCRLGDKVDAGDLLLRLDNREKAARCREALAERDYARAELQQVQLAAANAWEIRKADAILAAAQARLAQIQTLHQQGQASQAELEAARRDAMVAEAEREMAKAALASRLAAAQRAAAVSEARYELAQRELAACELRAPFAGRIARVGVNEYERVDIGQSLIEIIADRTLLAKFLLPGEVQAHVRIGHRFRLRILPPAIWQEARITHMAPTLEAASNTCEVHAEIENADGRLTPGMSAVFTARDACSPGADSSASEPQATNQSVEAR